MRQVIIDLGEDNYRVAEFPSLPGCNSQDRTRKVIAKAAMGKE
jgi:predicted RNase H-like HicB family nuclease